MNKMTCEKNLKSERNLEYRKAIDYIFNLIKDKELKVGSRLPTERCISETLNIGRNSTREAISILSGMGFIESVQGSGNYVSKNTGESIRQIIDIMMALGTVKSSDICQFRRAMEKSVCDVLISSNLSAKWKSDMEQIICEMENLCNENDRVPLSTIVLKDKEFHMKLVEATGNNLWITVMEAVSDVYDKWIGYVIEQSNKNDTNSLVSYHKNIYVSLLSQKRGQIMDAIDKHYNFIENFI